MKVFIYVDIDRPYGSESNMEYFDGTVEDLQYNHRDYIPNKKIISSFKAGSSALKYALFQSRIATLLTVIFAFLISFLPSLIGFMEGFVAGISIFFGSFLFILIFYLFIMAIVFPVLWGSARKFAKATRTELTPEVIDIRYFEAEGNPKQASIIPYRLIRELRPVSDDDWKNDLGMGSIIRIIAGWPKRGHNTRFLKGTSRKNIFTVQLDRTAPVHSYKRQVGMMGRMFPILSAMDMHTLETEDRSTKIYFSLDQEHFKNMKELVEKMRQKVLEEENRWKREYDQPVEQAPVDDSSFMDYFNFNEAKEEQVEHNDAQQIYQG